jgi:hypothetical protein
MVVGDKAFRRAVALDCLLSSALRGQKQKNCGIVSDVFLEVFQESQIPSLKE